MLPRRRILTPAIPMTYQPASINMTVTPLRSILVLVLAALLSACNSSSPPAQVDGGTSAPSSAPVADATVAPPSSVSLSEYTPAESSPGGNCALDVVNGGAAPSTPVSAGSEVGLSGWVADAQNAASTDAILVLTGTSKSYSGVLPTGGDRPDVAAALANESARTSGFNASASLSGVEPGEYALSIVQGGSAPVSCGLNKSLSVSAGG